MSNQNPLQYANDSEEMLRQSMEGNQVGIWTTMPCIVTAVDLTKMTLTCQLAIQGRMEDSTGVVKLVNVSPIQDVPIVFPSGGGFTITFPIVPGDEVLVHFAARCIDSWWQNGGYENVPMEFRMHDLSDGFAIPGPKSQPRVISGISATNIQIRTDDGSTKIEITPGGQINLVGAVNFTGNLIVTGNLGVTGTITGNTATIPIGLATHKHTGVTTGGGTSGPATP